MAHPQSKCYISLNKNPKDIILPHPFNKQVVYSTSLFCGGQNANLLFQVDIILPHAVYEVVRDELVSQVSPAWQYHRLRIPLSAVLEKDFYNKYIKTGMGLCQEMIYIPMLSCDYYAGNIVMLSEGRIEADNVYSMSDGKHYIPWA
jgi:ribonuclease P/MRP protein subunit RPP40